MTTTLVLILAIASFLLVPFTEWLEIRQFNKEREEWQKERAKLLDRIQSGGLAEFKAQERAAETPLKRREKDEFTAKMEGEPWLLNFIMADLEIFSCLPLRKTKHRQ